MQIKAHGHQLKWQSRVHPSAHWIDGRKTGRELG